MEKIKGKDWLFLLGLLLLAVALTVVMILFSHGSAHAEREASLSKDGKKFVIKESTIVEVVPALEGLQPNEALKLIDGKRPFAIVEDKRGDKRHHLAFFSLLSIKTEHRGQVVTWDGSRWKFGSVTSRVTEEYDVAGTLLLIWMPILVIVGGRLWLLEPGKEARKKIFYCYASVFAGILTAVIASMFSTDMNVCIIAGMLGGLGSGLLSDDGLSAVIFTFIGIPAGIFAAEQNYESLWHLALFLFAVELMSLGPYMIVKRIRGPLLQCD